MPPSAVKLSIRGSTGFSLWVFQAMHGAFFSILLVPMGFGQTAKHPNYEDDVRPIFSRRCFACHSAAEMRAGLSLESYAGVLKGGGSGEILKPGRPGASILYHAVAHEGNGVPQMPLGLPNIPDAEIAVIRDWMQQGALEN